MRLLNKSRRIAGFCEPVRAPWEYIVFRRTPNQLLSPCAYLLHALTLSYVEARMSLVFRLWSLWHGTTGFLRSSASTMEAAPRPVRHSWHSRRHSHHRIYLHGFAQRAFTEATSTVSKTPLSCAEGNRKRESAGTAKATCPSQPPA